MAKSDLSAIKCFLLDMDGTLHVSGTLIDGAADAVERMRRQARVIFLTNNTSLSRLDYVHKLCNMGINADEGDIYTAGNATADYLNKNHSGKKIFLLGTPSLYAEFEKSGIKLTQTCPDIVVIGYDTSLTYENLCKACSFIRSGVPYLLTHPDINCPAKNGYVPDVGSFHALISLSTGKEPFIVCGKPNVPIGEGIKGLTGCENSQIAMVGDRLSTDIRFSLNNSFVPVLVLTGESTEADLAKSGLKGVKVLNSVADWDKK